MENKKPKSTRGDARERRATHLSNWQSSGLTQVEYCRRENIGANSFSNWKRKLRERAEAENEMPFVELPPVKTKTNDMEVTPPIFEFAIGPAGVTFRLNLNGVWNWSPGA